MRTEKNEQQQKLQIQQHAEMEPNTQLPLVLDQTSNNCGKKGLLEREKAINERYAKKPKPTIQQWKRNRRRRIVGIYIIKSINRIVVKQNYLTATVKTNGTYKEFIIVSGSPISKIPIDNKTMKEPEVEKGIKIQTITK